MQKVAVMTNIKKMTTINQRQVQALETDKKRVSQHLDQDNVCYRGNEAAHKPMEANR